MPGLSRVIADLQVWHNAGAISGDEFPGGIGIGDLRACREDRRAGSGEPGIEKGEAFERTIYDGVF